MFLCPYSIDLQTEHGTLLINSSTTESHTSIGMSKEAEKLGVTFMDAPVSGDQYKCTYICM